MKLKRIEAVCKNGACIRINRAPDGRLWIGDEASAYYAGALKDITKESLLTIFDVPEDKWESYAVAETAVLYDDNDPAERLISRRLETELVTGGKRLAMFELDGDIYSINTKYLKPLEDEKDITLYVRGCGTATQLFIKKGLFCIAVIACVDLSRLTIKDDVAIIADSL